MPSELYKCNVCGKVYTILSNAATCEDNHLVFTIDKIKPHLSVNCTFDPGSPLPKTITVYNSANSTIYALYSDDMEGR
jgi:hypothetical protein